jgi:hypothetical protein
MKSDKIIIHTYPGRYWYVKNFLVPSLLDQGAKHILIANDKHKLGNLLSFVLSLENLKGDYWHLQDDIIICSDFIKRIENYSGLVCGICCKNFDNNINQIGLVPISSMWYSFPCIRIPEEIATAFYNFYMKENKPDKFNSIINSGKMDDLLFMEFLKHYYPKLNVINLAPNLCDHVDFLLGGSIANQQRQGTARAAYFNEPELVTSLMYKLQVFNH